MTNAIARIIMGVPTAHLATATIMVKGITTVTSMITATGMA